MIARADGRCASTFDGSLCIVLDPSSPRTRNLLFPHNPYRRSPIGCTSGALGMPGQTGMMPELT